MCGIFGYIGKRTNAAQIVFEGIKTLEYRGYDSWGVGVVPIHTNAANKIIVHKEIGKIGNATIDDMPLSSLAFGHTRWATHGGVTIENTHPHLDCTGETAIIHNGIIENYDIFKNKLKKTHAFKSETDSEVAAHMIEDALPTMSFDEAVRTTFTKFNGSNAIIAINKKERQIIAIRNGSPLVVGFGDKEQFVASDAAGLLPHTKKVYFLEDNEMAILTDTEIKIFNALTGKEKTITPTTLTWNVTASTLNGFTTFMEKEIHEQIPVLQDLLTQMQHHQQLSIAITQARGTYLIGCGSAYYACLAGSFFFSSIAKRHVNNCVASEFSYQEDFINNKSLVIGLSQSGETMDLIDAVKRAKQKKGTIGSIVNVEGSTLWRISDIKIPSGAGPEMAVASTKDLTAKLAHLMLVAYAAIDKTNQGRESLTKAISELKRLLEPENISHTHSIATMIKHAGHLFVVGRGLSYPAALEIAMKIKEISYIHAEGLAAGELKHGTIALIEKGTPCIVLAPDDETYGANIAAAMELKARGAMIIGISSKQHEVFNEYIEVKNCKEATIIPAIVVGQLLALAITKQKGFDPDKPRNLAKSVTVK